MVDMARGYYKNLAGQKFGKLTALTPEFRKFEKNGKKSSIVYWECRCECGNLWKTQSGALLSGATTSCKECRTKQGAKILDREALLAKRVYASNVSGKNKREFFLETDIPYEKWYELSQAPCFYCGLMRSNDHSDYRAGRLLSDTVFKYNGLDRVDSSLDYKLNNVVTCCKYCNWFKLDFSAEEFLARARKIYQHLELFRDDFSHIKFPWINLEFEEIFIGVDAGRKNQTKFDKSKDIVGQLIGTLLVGQRVSGGKNSTYSCTCNSCGGEFVLQRANLTRQKGCRCVQRYADFEKRFWNNAYQDNILGPNRRKWNVFETDISLGAYKHIASLNCFYCDKSPACHKTDRHSNDISLFSTIDKLNPESHYHFSNIVPACKECNFGKNRQSFFQFLESIKRLVEFQQQKTQV